MAQTHSKGEGRPMRYAEVIGSTFRIYAEPRLLVIFGMGFASGLPLALSSATLFFWLREAGVSLTAIGLFARLTT